MAITRWNPFAELEEMLDRYSRTTGQPRGASSNGREVIHKADWAPAVDITETKEAFVIKAELPGIKREDVKVGVMDGVLTISGERREEAETNDQKSHRIERFFGSFARSFTLPDNVDENNIQAEYKDGVLKLVLAKQEKAKPRAIEVKVS